MKKLNKYFYILVLTFLPMVNSFAMSGPDLSSTGELLTPNNKVIVYIWNKKDKNPGHVSLKTQKIQSDKTILENHISFVPLSPLDCCDSRYFSKREADFLTTLDEDIIYEKCGPDHRIELHKLDVDAINSEWHNMKEKIEKGEIKFRLVNRRDEHAINCSGIARTLLIAGGIKNFLASSEDDPRSLSDFLWGDFVTTPTEIYCMVDYAQKKMAGGIPGPLPASPKDDYGCRLF